VVATATQAALLLTFAGFAAPTAGSAYGIFISDGTTRGLKEHDTAIWIDTSCIGIVCIDTSCNDSRRDASNGRGAERNDPLHD